MGENDEKPVKLFDRNNMTSPVSSRSVVTDTLALPPVACSSIDSLHPVSRDSAYCTPLRARFRGYYVGRLLKTSSPHGRYSIFPTLVLYPHVLCYPFGMALWCMVTQTTRLIVRRCGVREWSGKQFIWVSTGRPEGLPLLLLSANGDGCPPLRLIRVRVVRAENSVPLRCHEHVVRGGSSQKNLVYTRATDTRFRLQRRWD